MSQKGYYSKNANDFLSFQPGAVVKLAYKHGRGKKCSIIKKDFKVVQDYGFHVLFMETESDKKLSVTKSNFITGEILLI